MRTGTKFWLALGVGIVFPLVIFAALTLQGFKWDAVTLGVILGAPVATFTAFGFFNVAASGQVAPPVELPK